MVKADQKILKVSNKDATGEISATIDGKFFIQENTTGDSYYIYDLDNIGIEITVDEEDSVKLKHGQKANVKFTGSSESFEGRVYYIQKIPTNGEVAVKVKVDYSDKIRLGCNAKVEILLEEEPDLTTPEYDLKNSTTKIGKTKISFKDQGNIESFDIDSMFEEYMNQMMSEMDMSEFEGMDGEMPLEFEGDQDELSEYYSNLWSDYWNEFWKNYYENPESPEIPDLPFD